MRRSAWVVAVAGALGLAALLTSGGCSSGGGGGEGSAPDAGACQACEPGAYVCSGNVLLHCLEDGSGYERTECLATQACSEADRQCIPSQCPSPDYRKCLDDHTVQFCSGTELTSQPCGSEEVCIDAACVPASCSDGDSKCGATGVLECVGGAWQTMACDPGQGCLEQADGTASCSERVCTPGQRFCADLDGKPGAEASVECNAWGTAGLPDTAVDCSAKGASCAGGLCACVESGGSTADAAGATPDASGGADAGTSADVAEPDGFIHIEADTPELKPPDIASATIDGEDVDFDSYAGARMTNMSEDGVYGTLQITLASGVLGVELEIRPVKLGYTGVVDSEQGGDITGFIGYNDGTAPQGVDFTYGAGTNDKGEAFAGSYHIEITRNDGPGGRVEGTFYGTLASADGSVQVVIENGTFAINHD